MLRKVCFICIVCIAYLQFSAATHHSAYAFLSKSGVSVTYETASIVEAIPQLADFYWEEDDEERLHIEKKWSRPQSDLYSSFLQTLLHEDIVLLNSIAPPEVHTTPLYISLGNLRI